MVPTACISGALNAPLCDATSMMALIVFKSCTVRSPDLLSGAPAGVAALACSGATAVFVCSFIMVSPLYIQQLFNC